MGTDAADYCQLVSFSSVTTFEDQELAVPRGCVAGNASDLLPRLSLRQSIQIKVTPDCWIHKSLLISKFNFVRGL